MAGQNSTPSRSTRADDLDLMKTLLVIGMVGTHVVQLLSFRLKGTANVVWQDYANLISFSGYMFAFGIGLGLPKPEGRVRTLWQRLRPILLLLLAAWVSSFAFALLVDRKPLNADLIIDVMSFRRLFGWSEFLASFFVLAIFTTFVRAPLLAIGRNPWALVIVSALALASTLVTIDAMIPLAGTIIGHTQYASFPLLAYLPWFLIGIWYGTNKLKLWHFVPALAATALFFYMAARTGEYPGRFPPSALWVAAPAIVLLGYLALTRWFCARVTLPRWVLLPGQHVLSFLIVSNLLIFAGRYLFNRPVRAEWVALLVTVLMLGAITLGWVLWRRWRPAGRPASAGRAPAAAR